MANAYLRHPNNFFMGTRMLTLEERGAYNDLLDLYIARDGELPDNPRQRAYDLAVDTRVWNRIKKALIEAGKLTIKDGNLTPRGGDKTLATCLAKSVAAKEAADSRWRNHKKTKKTRDADAMPIKTRHIVDIDKSISSPKQPENNFENWWQHYPRKVAKGQARTAYKTAIKKIPHDDLCKATEKFATIMADKDVAFLPYPATWLNGERWHDEPEAINPLAKPEPAHNGSGGSGISAALRLISND